MNSMNSHLPVIGVMQPNGAYAAKRLLRVWRRHLGLFLGVFVVLAAIGVAVVFSLKPTYTATATVVLTTRMRIPWRLWGSSPWT